MNRLIKIILLSLPSIIPCLAQNYNWPCLPFDQQHNINGTFCENRTGTNGARDHFHDGVDIALQENSAVYSVISGQVTGISTREQSGINAYVRVGNYAYVHVDPAPGITIGSPVTAFETIIGTTNSWNHIHFKDGLPNNEINALRETGGLSPFTDQYDPAVDYIKFFANETNNEFPSNRVYGAIEIVARARDRTDGGPIGDNNGVYSIGYQIFDSTGANPVSDAVENIVFYNIPSSDDYITNVYFPGSDLSTYIYTVTNRINSDGYWDTDQLDFGTYQVRVFTEDTRSNIAERWESVQIVPVDTTPPSTPDLVSLTGNNSGQWMMQWKPNDSNDHAGYNFFYSYDNNNWTIENNISNSLTDSDTQYVFDGFPVNVTIYFRLTAYDDASFANTSDPSDSYGVRLSDFGANILIVDGFDRMDGYWQEPSHTFVYQYGSILSDFNLAFNTCSDGAIIDGKIFLEDYSIVIYILGDESGEDKVLTTIEQDILKTYLKNGGKLIISGSEIGNDLNTMGTLEDQQFYQTYLKAEFVADSTASLQVNGESGTIFEDYIAQINPPPGSAYKSDIINPLGSISLLNFEDGSNAGIYFNGHFEGGTSPGHLAHFSFPLELITDDEQRNELLANILNLFGVISSINNQTSFQSPLKFELYNNYPNPFNPTTIINYELPITNYVSLSIYNSIGQIVATLVDEKQPAGRYAAKWDASDFSSGVYYYIIKVGDVTDVKKMILLK